MLSRHDPVLRALPTIPDRGTLRSELISKESPENLRSGLDNLVADVIRWCRKASAVPLPPSAVPGTNDRERSQLAALGGVANALAHAGTRTRGIRSFPLTVQRWLEEGNDPPTALVDGLLEYLNGSVDPLALIYERIVAGQRRRQLGTFFTPPSVLEYLHKLVDATLPKPPSTIVDPGAGVGAFTTSALDWWPDAHVHAVDVNVVTLGLLAARPKADTGNDASPRLHLSQDDFLNWIHKEWTRTPGPRLILGNPPYTRHQQLTAEMKAKAQKSCGDLAPGLRAGMSTYFLAASLNALRAEDSLCLLLPRNWLEADYARPVRKHLRYASNRQIKLHLFSNEVNIFPGAQVTAMILLVGPRTQNSEPISMHEITGSLEEGFVSSNSSQLARDRPVSVSLRSAIGPERPLQNHSGYDTTPLGQVARVRRGIATGANSFFLRTLAERQQLNPSLTVRAISRLRSSEANILDIAEHEKLSESGQRCWLLALTQEDAGSSEVKALLEQGEAQRINERYLCRNRTPWYVTEKIAAPDILIGPMGKDGFRVVINSVGAIPTNTLYGIRLMSADHDPDLVHRLAAWLSSCDGQTALRIRARRHGDGLLKLEPGSLSSVPIPKDVLISRVPARKGQE